MGFTDANGCYGKLMQICCASCAPTGTSNTPGHARCQRGIWQVIFSLATRQLLLGDAVVLFRAAAPNWLEVSCRSGAVMHVTILWLHVKADAVASHSMR